MNELAAFRITEKWPPRHPDRIQLYSLPTPNGVKVSIMLEETGLPYEPHRVGFDTDEQKTAAFYISTFPWVSNLIGFYNAGELVGIADFTHVSRALKAFALRPAVIRGYEIPQSNAKAS
jgi:hypothetical protein